MARSLALTPFGEDGSFGRCFSSSVASAQPGLRSIFLV
jgi:hypothetical protein